MLNGRGAAFVSHSASASFWLYPALSGFSEKQTFPPLTDTTLTKLVPGVGVEPTRLSSVDFESTASANSATRAMTKAAKRRSDRVGVHAKFSPAFFERIRLRCVFLPVSYPFFLGSS